MFIRDQEYPGIINRRCLDNCSDWVKLKISDPVIDQCITLYFNQVLTQAELTFISVVFIEEDSPICNFTGDCAPVTNQSYFLLINDLVISRNLLWSRDNNVQKQEKQLRAACSVVGHYLWLIVPFCFLMVCCYILAADLILWNNPMVLKLYLTDISFHFNIIWPVKVSHFCLYTAIFTFFDGTFKVAT